MKEQVYKMTRSGDCGDYAMLLAMQKLGIDVTEGYMISTKDLGITKVFQRMKKEGKISDMEEIKTLGGIDFWLKKGHYIVSGTGKMSFDSVRNPPHIQKFDGSIAHNFCIIGRKDNLLVIQDSQGPDFADHGLWYVDIKDFRKLKKFRIYP